MPASIPLVTDYFPAESNVQVVPPSVNTGYQIQRYLVFVNCAMLRPASS